MLTYKWTHSKSVQCSEKSCSSLYDEWFSKFYEGLLGSMFDVCPFEAKIQVFEFDHQLMNIYKFVGCSKNDVWVHSMFDKMMFDPSLVSKAFKGPN